MSPLWRERVIVGLAPDRISALRISGGWRQRLVSQHEQALESTDATRWEDAVQALSVLLSSADWSKAAVDVVLSNHWVRYAIVPGQRDLGAAALQTLADLVFEKIYGDLRRQWEIRVSPAAHGASAVASGISLQLLAALRDACGSRLRMICPALMPVFNQARRSIATKASGRLAMMEHGRITLASLRDGHWQSIVSRAVAAGDPDALSGLLRGETVLDGQAVNGTLWLCNLGGEIRMPSDTPRQVQTIAPAHLAGSRPGLATWCLG